MNALRFQLLILSGLVSLLLTAQSPMEKFANDPSLSGAALSLVALDADGIVIDSYLPDQKLCPASVWKLYTTSTAIEKLGANYKFRTTLVRTGPIEKGVLQGSIMVMGSGDPTFGSKYFKSPYYDIFNRWAADIKAAGIDSIAGNVIVNAALFNGDGLPGTRTWEDMGNYYGTSAFAFNIADNSYSLRYDVSPKVGELATLQGVFPEVPDLVINSEVQSSTAKGDQAYIFGSPQESIRTVRGTLPAGSSGFEIKGSIPNPPLFGAYHLMLALKANGIGSQGYQAEYIPPREPIAFQVLGEHLSPTLQEIAAETNRSSNNLFAEGLLLALGLQANKATPEGGVQALCAHLEAAIPAIGAIFAYDGSGLSRYTAVSAVQTAQLLGYMKSKSLLNEGVVKNLPVAAQSGTLKRFGAGTPLSGKFRGKSGSMDKVQAYAGYLTCKSGKELRVVLIANNFDVEGNLMRLRMEQCLLELQAQN